MMYQVLPSMLTPKSHFKTSSKSGKLCQQKQGADKLGVRLWAGRDEDGRRGRKDDCGLVDRQEAQGSPHGVTMVAPERVSQIHISSTAHFGALCF